MKVEFVLVRSDVHKTGTKEDAIKDKVIGIKQVLKKVIQRTSSRRRSVV